MLSMVFRAGDKQWEDCLVEDAPVAARRGSPTLPGLVFVNTRVVVVDDVADVRWLLRLNLDADERFEVVGEAGDGLEAVEVVRQTQPDVVVLDLRMPRMDGLEAATEIARVSPQTSVVINSAVREEEVAVGLCQTGVAASYLTKGSSPRAIADAVALAGRRDGVAGSSSPRGSPPAPVGSKLPGARHSHSYRCPPPACAPP